MAFDKYRPYLLSSSLNNTFGKLEIAHGSNIATIIFIGTEIMKQRNWMFAFDDSYYHDINNRKNYNRVLSFT